MKLFIKLLVGLVALVIIAVVALLLIVDPNDYKEQIQTQVKQSINRDLAINGDISWSFYPQLGFDFGEIELKNLDGFNRTNLLKIDNAAVAIAVLPLIKGEVQIGELTLNGLIVNLITNKDGRSNLDNMFPEKTTATPQPAENTPVAAQNKKSFDPNKLQLAGINIENVQIEVQDLQVNGLTKIDIKHIHLGQFTLGKPADLSIVTDLLVAQMQGHVDLQAKLIVARDFSSIQLNNLELQTSFTGEALPNGKINSTINSNIGYDLTTSTADLNAFVLQVGDINLKGSLSAQTANKTKIRFSLQGNHWDVTPYMPPASETSPQEATTQPVSAANEQEPDLSFLNNLDVQGQLVIAGITANDIKVGEISTSIAIDKGQAQIKPLTAQLYEGLLTVNATLADAQGRNSYQLQSTLKGIQILPLLKDVAKVDLLSGTTEFNLVAKGNGLTATKIKSGLVANGDFTLLDGELYGINIPQKLRAMKAKLTGQATPTEADVKKTDFASLSGTFMINEGIFNNKKLLMLSPIMRLDGSGLANILQETLDYQLNVTPLSKSGADTDFGDLSGITIPLTIKGSFSDPKFSLNTEGALKDQAKMKLEEEKQKLKEKAQQKLDEKSQALEEKLKSKLGSFFN